jgi:hypothetical protein
VGDWRVRATPGQRLALDRICGRWLDAHGYEPDDRSEIASALKSGSSSPFEALRWELAMARGGVACWLRCLSLRHPRLARSIKPFLGIAPEAPLAKPAPIALPANVRLDVKETAKPHRMGSPSVRLSVENRPMGEA